MPVLFLTLLILNISTELLFYKKLMTLNVLEKKNCSIHTICSGLRCLWILVGTWLVIPIPFLLMGMLLLMFLNIKHYQNRKVVLCNFSLVMYLLFVALLMIVIGVAGLFGVGADTLRNSDVMRVSLVNITALVYNLIIYLSVYCYPNYLWRENYDNSKVAVYTWFLLSCVLYQILDAVIITLYEAEEVSNVLLLCGNILIVVLILNFLAYNDEFAQSEEARRAYEESEILLARQYFEKQELKKLSSLDPLTKAYNRWEISALMQESMQKGHKLVCVFVDLDGLKTINDTYGHASGDLTLKRFADASTEILQEKGYLARIGGDEFLLIFLDQEVADIDNRIKELQVKLLEPKEEKNRVSFSYGIAQGEDSVENCILQADRQMYLDKNRKRRGAI